MATVPPLQNPALQQPDLGTSYQEVYDLLGQMYWEASRIDDKDLIFGTREAVGEIIDAMDQQALKNNEQAFKTLAPKFLAANAALKNIQDDISNITKNISTAAAAIVAISKILSLFA